MIRWKRNTICDHCGKLNPQTLTDRKGRPRRITNCCAIDDRHLYPYAGYLPDGTKRYAVGKAITVRLRFPIQISWVGFWRRTYKKHHHAVKPKP